ncbi:MAG: metallophosphoesterase [Porphyromonadaceae bacterium]|nr:metallophosphoesterase [Porphyromonadaceae bacterium]
MPHIKFVLFLLLIIPDVYILFFLLWKKSKRAKVLHEIPLALTIVSLGIVAINGLQQQGAAWRLFIALIVCITLPKLFFFLFSLLGKIFSLLWSRTVVIGNIIGFIIGTVALGMGLYGSSAGWKRISVREVQIVSDELPASFDGYRLVQLSDLHVGTYSYAPQKVDEIVQRVNGLNPDAILFTGDLVNLSSEELLPFMNQLSRLKAKDGVFSVLGNHDYCTYQPHNTPEKRQEALEKLKNRERQMGWDLLLNEHRILYRGTDSIAVVGVENDGNPPFPALGDLPKATAGLPESLYKILLSHDPTHWRRRVLPETNIQLTLSGHTHAMQVKVCGFSPSSFTYPEWGGLYLEGERALHVCTGTGSNLPFRWGAWPEIVVLTLHTP